MSVEASNNTARAYEQDEDDFGIWIVHLSEKGRVGVRKWIS